MSKTTETPDPVRLKGWTFLIQGRLKAYLEGQPLPAWKD